jgi:carboxymethylenebutenolidase
VPIEGREKIYKHLQSCGIDFQWQEVNAQHAFMRDEGERYDSALAIEMYLKARDFFAEYLVS